MENVHNDYKLRMSNRVRDDFYLLNRPKIGETTPFVSGDIKLWKSLQKQ